MLRLHLCKTYAEAIAAAGRRAADFGKDPSVTLYAFCEDKLSMSLEREIATACGGGTFNVQVNTFSRFIHNNLHGDAVMLSKESSAMAVKSILLSGGDGLTCFKRSAFNPGTAVTLYELIAQLKSANVSVLDLRTGALSLEGALRGKIEDIIRVYSAYESYVSERGFYDSNSYLAIMPTLLEEQRFEGCSAMLVGFSSLTRQGVEIVKVLAKRMADLDVFLLSGENGELYTNELKTVLMREIEGFCVIESTVDYDAERSKIMQNLFDPSFKSRPQRVETDKVEYYEAVDPDDEVKRIAGLIRSAVLGGMRYRDISVAVGSPSAYRSVIGRIFADYQIPYCLDDPRLLSTHPLASLTVSLLDVIRVGFRSKEVIALVKNPYFVSDKDASDRFENFVLKHALTAKNIKSGLYHTENDDETYGPDREIFENERKRVLALSRECKTAGDFVGLIKGALVELGAEALAEEQARRLWDYGDASASAFTQQAYRKVCEVLDSVNAILGDQPMSVADFRNVLISGYSACKVAVLPQLADAVYVGDYKECKYLEHKILFAAGLSGDVPFTKSDTAVLTDRDLARLEKFHCIVEPKIKIVNRRERENVGSALLSFTEKLYLSRSVTSVDGKPLTRSRVVDYLLSSFTRGGYPLPVLTSARLKAMAKAGVEEYRKNAALRYSAGRPAMQEFIGETAQYLSGSSDDCLAEATYFSVLKDVLPSEAERADALLARGGKTLATVLDKSGELIFNGDALSASVLEAYFGCPFACFMQYGVKAQEREEGQVKKNEYGTFLHDVLERYVNVLREDRLSPAKRITDKVTSDGVVEEIFATLSLDARFARYLETDKYKTLFAFVKKEAKRVAFEIFSQFENSGFIPVEAEVSFRDGGKYPAIRLNTPYGVKKINGKIDRVDKCGSYVRIIDYKTGKTHEDDEAFYTGNNLQLYLYMNAYVTGEDKPAGAYYFPVSDRFAEKGKGPVYAMRGKTLQDMEVIMQSDTTLTKLSRETTAIDATLSFTDSGVEGNNKIIPPSVMQAYLDYSVMISEKGAEEIAEGIIAPSPYEGECAFCKFSAVCGFDVSTGRARKVKPDGRRSVDSEMIAEAVEVQNEINANK